jgi:hypothetical protein
MMQFIRLQFISLEAPLILYFAPLLRVRSASRSQPSSDGLGGIDPQTSFDGCPLRLGFGMQKTSVSGWLAPFGLRVFVIERATHQPDSRAYVPGWPTFRLIDLNASGREVGSRCGRDV